MLTEFNEGGRHEENPYGGIPQGSSSNGQMNTVEQGETKKGNFVYSDRLYINEDLAKQMNLPSYIKGKTFANASKSINDKFKDRNDIHTKATQKELLDRLANAQEYLKQQEAQINESMQSNMQTPEFGNQFKGGGLMGLDFSTQDDLLNSGNTPVTNGTVSNNKFFNFLKNNNNIGSVGDFLSTSNIYDKQINKANSAGFEDNKAFKDNLNSRVLNSAMDGVASAFGPVGTAARGLQKLGKGIGDSIGGDGGAIISGIFSPQEGALSAFTDKKANIGEKALSMIPGVGNLLSNKRANKRLNNYNETERRKNNFWNNIYDENNNDTKVFAGGGLLDNTNPIVKNKQLSGNNSIGSDIINNKLPNQGGSLSAKLLGEINDISKVDSGYRILYDTPEGIKHEIVKNNAFKGMSNLPELKRYYYKKGIINDPSLIDSPEKIELLKKGWQSSGYNPSQVTYPQAIEDYRKATGQKGFYTPEQLSTYRPMAKGGFLPFSTEKDDPNYIPNYDDDRWLSGKNAYDFVTEVNNRNKINQSELDYELQNNPDFASPDINFNKIESSKPMSNKEISKQKNKINFNKLMTGLGDAQRYAPVLGNLLQRSKIGPAEVDKAIKNNYMYNKQLMDTKALENIASQEAYNTNQVLAQSGLTGNQLLSAMMGSQLNRTKAISDAYQQVNQHNINENKLAEQVKQQNESDYINDSRYVRETNAQNRANRDTQISKFNSEIYNALGDIGKENIFKKQAEKLTGYSWMGDYLMSNPEYKSKFEAIEKDPTLDDTSKYAKRQMLIKEIFQGMTPEQLASGDTLIQEVSQMGHTKKYGGYLTPKFKKY